MPSIRKDLISLASFGLAGGAATYYTTRSFGSGVSTGLINGGLTILLNNTLNKDSKGYKRIALTAAAIGITYFCEAKIFPKFLRQKISPSAKDFLPPLLFSACIGSLPFLFSSSTPPSQEDASKGFAKPPRTYDLAGEIHWHRSPARPENQTAHHHRMTKNLKKAIEEHRKQSPDSPYITFDQLQEEEKVSLIFSYGSSEEQGLRTTMEDEHFYHEDTYSILAGVFDGHGGKTAATHAKEQAQALFFELLRTHDGNVVKTFEVLCQRLHGSYSGSHGTTALICYFDKATQMVYTATLGDAEANIYRRTDGQVVSIPLSPIRDWNTDRKFVDKTVYITDHRRKPRLRGTLNVSRSIGDKDYPAISQKPKVTCCQLQPDDVLILCCDGLKDFVPEKMICQMVRDHQGTEEDLAKVLTTASTTRQDTFGHNDNVSVIVIRAQAGSK